MKEVKVLSGQTFIDISMQELGTSSRAFEIAALNNMSFTDSLIAGSTVLVPDIEINKKEVSKIMSTVMNKPASEISEDSNSLILEGVGYWGIELDFVVS